MPAHWDFPRSIASARVLVAVGGEHGLGPADCLRGSGLSLAGLQAPEGEMQAEQELRIIRNLLEKLGPGLPLGYSAGARYHPTNYGALGFAILSSPSLRAAIDLGLRFLRLSTVYCRCSVEEQGGDTLALLDASELPEDLRLFLVERDLSTILSFQRDLLPTQMPAHRIDIALPAPPYAKHFEALLGYPMHFNAARSCIVLSTALLSLPLPQSDPYTLTRYEAECQRLLERRRPLGEQSDSVRRRLLANPAQMPTVADMANALGLHMRTLQRQLADEGVAYENLVDEVRETLAEELLKTTDLTIEEVAVRLGYSEISAFSRAFKRWKGVAPSLWRG